MRFDLRSKKSEVEWAEAAASVFIKLAETVFRLLGWATAIAAVKLAATRTHSSYLAALADALELLVMAYLWSFFLLRFELVAFEDARSSRLKFRIHVAINTVLAVGLYWIAQHAADRAVSELIAAAAGAVGPKGSHV